MPSCSVCYLAAVVSVQGKPYCRRHGFRPKEAEIARCSQQVLRPGSTVLSRQCLRAATVNRDGKWYCYQHDPEETK